MTKLRKGISLLLSCVCALGLFSGCDFQKKSGDKDLYAIKLPDTVKSVDDPEGYINLQNFMAQAQNQEATMDGIIQCPWYEVKVNGKKVYSYSVPMIQSELHSFTYIDATEDAFPMQVEIKASYDVDEALVIPEKFGIPTEVDPDTDTVRFTVNSCDDYNVLFNRSGEKTENGDEYFSMDRPYSLFIRTPIEKKVPKGYKLIEFKPGLHYITKYALESNTYVYMHPGAYLVCIQPDELLEQNWETEVGMKNWKPLFSADGSENIIIEGHGVIDFSNLTWRARHPLYFTQCENVEVNGVSFINAPAWHMVFHGCNNVKVDDAVLFGYRTNSDGIAICDTSNASVTNSWIRSGDDLFEVKAYDGYGATKAENIVWRHNQAWAEKTRSFGFIQESEIPASNILYEDCSSLSQTAVWEEAMGAFLVIVGDYATVSDVRFVNCDSYYCKGYVINLSVGFNQWSFCETEDAYEQGTIHDITFENFKYYSGGKGVKIRNQGTPENFYNITFKNIYEDGKVIQSLDDMKISFAKTVTTESLAEKFSQIPQNWLGKMELLYDAE